MDADPPPLSCVNPAGVIAIVHVGPTGSFAPQPIVDTMIALHSAIIRPAKHFLAMLHLLQRR